jgi:ketosteroid isomerase-like protein
VDDEPRITEHLVARVSSILSERWYRGDPYGYVDLCGDDVTLFAPGTKGRLSGRATMRNMYSAAEGKILVPRVEIVDPRVRLMGDAALLTYNVREFAGGDSQQTGGWDATELYRRLGDDWQIIHAHWSVTQ